MSSVEYLFNSRGKCVAFRLGKYLYDEKAKWIGWFPWGDNDAVTTKGKYLGSIVNENRFYFFSNKPYRGYPGYPGYPSYPGYPGYPGYAGYSPLPIGAKDVTLPKDG
ncbi:hypothetical protein P0F25_003261 [Vibrio metschnikovii]|uniref:hypothetical protein n=1 Tax=Vibrio metschnikovii TaxID=28172 RepID=UPI002A595C99|nr:hypothetical protein [Vibrio metschnikovii]